MSEGNRYLDPPAVYPNRPPPPRSPLTVSEVERMAKAGVKIDFEQIASQVVSDPPPPTPRARDELTEAFWDRYQRNMRARHSSDRDYGMRLDGQLTKWQICATDGKDKINVYVAPTDGSAPFILQDEKCLFPSDALFASLDLRDT